MSCMSLFRDSMHAAYRCSGIHTVPKRETGTIHAFTTLPPISFRHLTHHLLAILRVVYQALFCFSCAIVQSVSQAIFCEMGAKKAAWVAAWVSTLFVPYRAKRVAWKARCSSIKVLMKK